MNAAKETSRALADALLPVRDRFAHKGDFGKVLLLCGSVGYTGAAAMAARAALRTGSGLIFLGVPEAVYPILAAKLDEPIVFPLPDDGFGRLSEEALPEILWRLRGCDACLAGPGLGQSDGVRAIIAGLLGGKVPLVLDADGINVLSGHIDLLRGAACPVVVTPHEGEFRRLGGELDALSRQEAAERLASDAGCVVLLKGHETVVTDGKETYVNRTGNPGMATGGSGDVLAGILVSLLGQGAPLLEGAAAAAWIHGSAGDLCAAEIGEYGLTPGDMIRAIPRLLK